MYSFFVGLLQPYLLLHLLVWLAVLNLWRKRRETRRRLLVLVVPLFALTLMSIPAAGYLAQGTLEWQYPALDHLPDDAEAIVVLGGWILPADEARTQFLPGSDSLYRCLHAARLYRQKAGGGIPVLVCGGKVDPSEPGPPVAEPMADFLRGQGVREDDLLLEVQSRSTHENAVEARRLLEARGIRRIVLVTDGCHMVRSERCFRKQGFEVLASPCGRQPAALEITLFTFLPDVHVPPLWGHVCHEWVGLVWYWVQGRI
jgi:uncharacterized SAM-binding protein YcdF (DUF218 family)